MSLTYENYTLLLPEEVDFMHTIIEDNFALDSEKAILKSKNEGLKSLDDKLLSFALERDLIYKPPQWIKLHLNDDLYSKRKVIPYK